MSQEVQQAQSQQEVINDEQFATDAVAYSDAEVARQIYGHDDVGRAVLEAEKEATLAVQATE